MGTETRLDMLIYALIRIKIIKTPHGDGNFGPYPTILIPYHY